MLPSSCVATSSSRSGRVNDSTSRRDDDPTRPTSRFAGKDGVTQEERDEAPESASLRELEQRLRPDHPDQLSLFAELPTGEFTAALSGLPPLIATSSLTLARSWYRRELEQARRPRNTISAYCNDLAVLEHLIDQNRSPRSPGAILPASSAMPTTAPPASDASLRCGAFSTSSCIRRASSTRIPPMATTRTASSSARQYHCSPTNRSSFS